MRRFKNTSLKKKKITILIHEILHVSHKWHTKLLEYVDIRRKKCLSRFEFQNVKSIEKLGTDYICLFHPKCCVQKQCL